LSRRPSAVAVVDLSIDFEGSLNQLLAPANESATDSLSDGSLFFCR